MGKAMEKWTVNKQLFFKDYKKGKGPRWQIKYKKNRTKLAQSTRQQIGKVNKKTMGNQWLMEHYCFNYYQYYYSYYYSLANKIQKEQSQFGAVKNITV